ncbi:hypothetical protein [Agromyces salentinus]|uniref:Uncharacterized protein n=1 Tax=Agromyces salentinus TaxID=269421 RepID=A0ABN2MGP5_9MICO|nr:hypothetical protein [Agromyces salentinus]
MSDSERTPLSPPAAPVPPAPPAPPAGSTGPTAVIAAGADSSTGPTTVIPTDAGSATGPTAAAAPDAPAWPFGATPASSPQARPAASASPPATAVHAASAARPTVRWGALVWALLYGTIAGVTLWIIVDPARREATAAWFADLNPLAAGLYAVIAVGVVVALFGIVGLLRRGERVRADARRS